MMDWLLIFTMTHAILSTTMPATESQSLRQMIWDYLSAKMNKEIAIRAADEAVQNVGVTESEKDNHGPAIKIYLATVGLPESFAWCAAFLKYRFLNAAKDSKYRFSEFLRSYYVYSRLDTN